MARPHRLLQILTVATSAYFALWACAPAATFRPMSNMDVDGNEFGLGGAVATPLSENDCYGEGQIVACGTGLNGQLWYAHRFSRWFSLGGTLFAGQQVPAFGAGVQMRFHWVDTENFQFGTDVEGGFAYAALGLPIAVRLVDGLWVYSAPSLGARFFQPVRIPLGLTWNATDHWGISAEAAYGFGDVNDPLAPPLPQSLTFGIAGSFRF